MAIYYYDSHAVWYQPSREELILEILITGASGYLGQKLSEHLGAGNNLRLIDIDGRDDSRIVEADLSEWHPDWVQQFNGVDTVVHLAGRHKATHSWAEMIGPNMDAVVNVFGAAIKGGAKRIVFASSNHTMGGYRDNGTSHALASETDPLPGLRYGNRADLDTTPYGAFKLAAERIGKCYADIHDISFIGVRIGFAHREDNSAENMHTFEDWAKLMWLSDRDYCQLMTRCIHAPSSVKFAIVNGMSGNRGMRWEIESLKDLIGYVPQDDVNENQ